MENNYSLQSYYPITTWLIQIIILRQNHRVSKISDSILFTKCSNIWLVENLNRSKHFSVTGGTTKCPKKHVKEDFCHVMAFAVFPEKPQNRWISFSHPFCLKIKSRAFPWNAQLSLSLKTLEYPIFPISESDGEMGHFKAFEHRKVGHFEEKSLDRL